MKVSTPSAWKTRGATLALAGLFTVLGGRPLWAQDYQADPALPAPADAEGSAPIEPNAPASPTDGPVRLARISDVSGSVTWRPDETAPWADATVNLPLRQGAQVWVSPGGRGEIQFDDGSQLRLGEDALLTLNTMYSDADGEFTDIKLNGGRIALRLKHEKSIFQVSTPFAVVRGNGPADEGSGSFRDVGKFSVDVGNWVNIAVQQGDANVEGDGGKTSLGAGDALSLSSATAPYQTHAIGAPDAWDQWNRDRDLNMEAAERGPSHHYLPSNQELVAGNLDHYGAWRDEGYYGHVWYPRCSDASWRPYRDGHWTWVSPFGWTWVSDEPWGWAPYHYGTWIRGRYGWAWVPGPVNQYWCPAVVSFSAYRGDICWTPLCPEDIVYPSYLTIGYRSPRWSLLFSIGSAGFYYANDRGRCEGRPWNSRYVNRFRYSPTYINRITVINRTTIINNYNFVPRNARFGGASVVSEGNFGHRGAFRHVGPDASGFYRQGHVLGFREAGTAGPVLVRPTLVSQSPTGSFRTNVAPPRHALERPVLRTLDHPAAAIAAAGAFHGDATRNFAGPASTNSNRPGRPPREGSVGTGRASGRPSSVERARAEFGLPGQSGSPESNETRLGPTGVLTRQQPVGEPFQENRFPGHSGKASIHTPSRNSIEDARANLGLPGDTVNPGENAPRPTSSFPSPSPERRSIGTGRGNMERADSRPSFEAPANSVPSSVARARSDMGLPVHNGSAAGYREPGNVYGNGETRGNANVPSYREPQPVYRAPQPAYREPQPAYQAPQPTYREPQPAYRAPQPAYRAPQPAYRAPQPTYREPQPSYGGRGNSGYSGGSSSYGGRSAPSYSSPPPAYREPATSSGSDRGSGSRAVTVQPSASTSGATGQSSSNGSANGRGSGNSGDRTISSGRGNFNRRN